MLLNFVLLVGFASSISADIAWPEYNQQCRDDAGPPFLDDSEAFPNGFYHDGSAAFPILQDDGSCADPMKEACTSRPSKKTAYLEGPISCGNTGWFCRIMPDENWPPQNLISDVNFGQCNSTASFDDAGFDQDGHCHGSSYDNTYYWWIRDHWFRGYNGRVRCCCGWFEGLGTNDPPMHMYGRRIANRCDYRRQVTPTEDITQCRDANEDHGMGFDDVGCDANSYSSQIGSPIPEDDGVCWEIAKFGHVDGGESNDDAGESNDDTGESNDDAGESNDDTGESNDDEEEEEEEEEEECSNRDDFQYNNKEARDCDWLEEHRNKRKICKKNWKQKAVKTHWCPETCGGCEEEDGEEDEGEEASEVFSKNLRASNA